MIFRILSPLLRTVGTAIIFFYSVCLFAIEKSQVITPEECPLNTVSPSCGEVPTAVAANGQLWVVFTQGGFVYVSTSSDGGTSYNKPMKVNALAQDVAIGGENRPKLVVDGSYVYVSWTKNTPGRYTGDIQFAFSNNGGLAFSPVKTVNTDGLLVSHRFDSMSVTKNGDVYLVWLDKRDSSGAAVYYSVSKDRGQSFSPNKKLAEHSCECCRVASVVSGVDQSRVTILWRHIFDGGSRDHGLLTLGNSDEKINRVSFNEWKIDGCPHHGPAIADSEQRNGQHLAWYSGGEKSVGLFYAFYSEAEKAAGPQVVISNQAQASHPQVLEVGGIIYYVWKQFDGEKTYIHARLSKDSGATWGEPMRITSTASGSDHPQLFVDDKGIPTLSWHTSNEGFRLIQLLKPIEPQSKRASIKAFDKNSWSHIQQTYQGQTSIVSFWSLSCPPCLKELEMLKSWQAQHPSVVLNLISTDYGAQEAALRFLVALGLGGAKNWIFSDPFMEKLYFSVDPSWQGTLPLTYLIGAGESEKYSGLMQEQTLERWYSLLSKKG